MFFSRYDGRRKATQPRMAYCGGDDDAKELAATLVSDVGFESSDAGPLRTARDMEPFALLMERVAHEGD